MSIHSVKEKVLPLLVIMASVGGTLAVFGSVPVIARITFVKQAPPLHPFERDRSPEATPANWL